jgi:outer membrane receptor for ferrienterochelin and colicins
MGLRSYLKTGLYSKLSFQYHGIQEYRRGGDMLEKPPHEANVAEQTEHNICGGGLNFDLFSESYKNHLNVFASFQHTGRKSYYGGNKDLLAYGTTRDLTLVGGAQYTHKWDRLWFMPAEFIAGAEYNYNGLEDESIGYEHYVNQIIHIFSGYAQNEWSTDHWGFLIGVRLDKHNLIDKPVFSPRVTVRFNPAWDVNFRACYSTGFRAPQAFDEDFHIAVVAVNGWSPYWQKTCARSVRAVSACLQICTILLEMCRPTCLSKPFTQN